MTQESMTQESERSAARPLNSALRTSSSKALNPVQHAERIFNALDVDRVGFLNLNKLKNDFAVLAKHEV
jgi:hypothetical protein